MDFDTLKALASEGPMTLVVDGQCMGDALPHGSKVRIEPKRFYWPGDIVVFGRSDGQLVSHRFLGYVRGRAGWLALAQADIAPNADSPVSHKRLVGVLRAIDNNPVVNSLNTRASAVLRFLKALSKLVARCVLQRDRTGTA